MSVEAYAAPLNESSVPSFDNNREMATFLSESISQRPVVALPQGSALRPVVTHGAVLTSYSATVTKVRQLPIGLR